jgi:hypothetical protein
LRRKKKQKTKQHWFSYNEFTSQNLFTVSNLIDLMSNLVENIHALNPGKLQAQYDLKISSENRGNPCTRLVHD